MFLEYYGLREQPFGVTPDPRFIYFGAAHREALASLLYAIETKRGFSAMVAEPGMGKTSLLFHMLESLRDSARTAFLFQTDGDSKDLIRGLLSDLGIKTRGKSIAMMHEDLNRALLEEVRSGRKMILVIDEAQNLDEASLESIRLLSNFETSTEKLMHIVLAGQPRLAEKLASSNLVQLRQRVSSIIRLEPFNPAETAAYIQHRLRASGYEGADLFSSEAIDLIARVSKGIPRNINSLCFHALSIGFATESKTIGADVLREVVADLDVTARSNRGPAHAAPASPRSTQSAVSEPAPTKPAATWPPPWLGSSYAPAPSHLDSGYRKAPVRSRTRGKGIAGVACAIALLVSMLVFSDPGLGLSETVPGRLSADVVNAVLSSGDSSSDFLPAPPNALKPPVPPPIETTAAETASEEATADDASSADTTAQNADDETSSTTPGTNEARSVGSAAEENENEATASAKQKENASIAGRRADVRPSSAQAYRGPSRVRAERRENLFEFALETFGKSNWAIVQQICELNPKIRGPYDMLSAGEWIQLPAEPVAFTPEADSRPIDSGR